MVYQSLFHVGGVTGAKLSSLSEMLLEPVEDPGLAECRSEWLRMSRGPLCAVKVTIDLGLQQAVVQLPGLAWP